VTRAALYCRISKDDEGKAAGVQRQQRDCEALAKAKGWTVGDVLTDNDRSAYDGSARPGYDQLLAGLRDGTYEAVIAWKLDRLTRKGVRGLVPPLDALDGRPLVCVHDAIDTTTPMGEGWAAMLAAMAKQESHNTGTRVAAFKADLAMQGVPAGGKRAFGYEPDGMTIRKSEAKEYRKAVGERLRGKAYSAIARDWNERGVKPPQAEQWSTTSVRYVLKSPRHAGLRTHQGEVVGKAAWPGIIDRATHEAVVALDHGGTQPRRRSLLTTLVWCACGTKMNRDGRSFRCRACGSTIKADRLEEFVEAMVVDVLDDSRKLAKALASSDRNHDDDDAAALDVAAAEAKLQELDEMLGAGELTRTSYLRARKAPEEKLAEARARLARRNGRNALERFRGGKDAGRMYERIEDVDERRAVIAAVWHRIVIHPAKGQGARFDVDRVDPIWRG
jgi:site-specific DNA recombinase